jgi:hypothetical protein
MCLHAYSTLLLMKEDKKKTWTREHESVARVREI